MLNVRGSSALAPDEELFQQAVRRGNEDNLKWLQRQLTDLGVRRKDTVATWLLLVGGADIYDFRLRVAQSHLRHDLTPSHWSHAALISTVRRPLGESRLLESSLQPQEGFRLPTMYNGIQGATLDRYADVEAYPNVALIKVPVDPALWRDDVDAQKSILGQFAEQRVVVDVPGLLLDWLGFVWGVGTAGNPILRGRGIPGASLIEALLGAAGYDLCPGLDSSAASPEAFWQTAKWWQANAEAMNVGTLETRYHVAGREADDTPLTLSDQIRIPEPPQFKQSGLTRALFDPPE